MQQINLQNPVYISQHAINILTMLTNNSTTHFIPHKLQKQHSPLTFLPSCNAVVHPITSETIKNYKRIINNPILKKTWEESMCKELGRLAQGYNDTKGTNMVNFMTHEQIRNIPKDRTVTYAIIVIDYRPQKKDPNRVRITAGGNLIDYPYELTTRTADLPTSKIL